MFESLDDGGVVASMGVASREENAACARRLEAMGELYARRAPEDDVERMDWAIDGHENVVAEISAELHVSRGRARGQLGYAIDLREKLPRVMGVFKTGVIDMRMVIALVNRVGLIKEPTLMARLDAVLAKWAPRWMRLSGPKLEQRVDWWVQRIDPAGRRVPAACPEQRYVEWFPAAAGLVSMCAQLRATDGAALDQRLDALADSVCRDDPRTRAQRQADALGALAAGLTELKCECESAACAAGQRSTGASIVVHVLAEQPTVTGTGVMPGYVPGFGPLPVNAVRDLAGTAKLKPLNIPHPSTRSEPGYRPSAALAEFVRCRDLTCRFPGCEQPAEFCDIDHTVPYQVGGPTHPSNLKLLCRCHHLLKTFYTGSGGWADTQLPDGTVVWTAPTGRTYSTKPGGALFFPILASSHRRRQHPHTHHQTGRVPRRDDAPAHPHPLPRTKRSHHRRTGHQRSPHRRRTPTIRSVAGRHLRTTTLLALHISPMICSRLALHSASEITPVARKRLQFTPVRVVGACGAAAGVLPDYCPDALAFALALENFSSRPDGSGASGWA